jgi:hypothetical protein
LIGEGTDEGGEHGVGVQHTEIDGDIGVKVHFPDEVATAAGEFKQAAEDEGQGGRGQGDDDVRALDAEAVPKDGGQEGR